MIWLGMNDTIVAGCEQKGPVLLVCRWRYRARCRLGHAGWALSCTNLWAMVRRARGRDRNRAEPCWSGRTMAVSGRRWHNADSLFHAGCWNLAAVATTRLHVWCTGWVMQAYGGAFPCPPLQPIRKGSVSSSDPKLRKQHKTAYARELKWQLAGLP